MTRVDDPARHTAPSRTDNEPTAPRHASKRHADSAVGDSVVGIVSKLGADGWGPRRRVRGRASTGSRPGGQHRNPCRSSCCRSSAHFRRSRGQRIRGASSSGPGSSVAAGPPRGFQRLERRRRAGAGGAGTRRCRSRAQRSGATCRSHRGRDRTGPWVRRLEAQERTRATAALRHHVQSFCVPRPRAGLDLSHRRQRRRALFARHGDRRATYPSQHQLRLQRLKLVQTSPSRSVEAL